MKQLLIKTALVLSGLLLGLFILECALRFIPYTGSRERDKLSSRFQPYYSSPQPALESFPNFSHDAAGEGTVEINGQRILARKPDGERRILFIGDSGTLGTGVDFSNSFPLLVKASLDSAAPGNTYTVINAGRKGLSTVGELKLLQDDLLPLKPDIVVLGLFMANDLNFNLAHTNTEKLSDANQMALRAFYFLRRHSALVHFLYVRSLALTQLHGLLEYLGLLDSTWVPIEYRLIDERGFNLMSYLEGETALYFNPPSELAASAFKLLEQLLQNFKALAAQQGFTFLVVIIPTHSSIVGQLTIPTFPDWANTLKEKGLTFDASEIDVHGPLKSVVEMCSRLQIDCINPIDRLSEAGTAPLLKHDDHLSVVGHQLVAQALFSHLKLLEYPGARACNGSGSLCSSAQELAHGPRE